MEHSPIPRSGADTSRNANHDGPVRAPGDCDACGMARICRAGPANGAWSLHHSPTYASPLHQATRNWRLVHRGEPVYRAGDPLTNLYYLRAGSAKIRVTNPSGSEQIAAFPISGTLLGLDAIATGTHECDAIALEDSLVCVLPFNELMSQCSYDLAATKELNRLIAQEVNQFRRLLTALGCMTTEGRVARFLVNLSEQMAANGYSAREFTLKMSREDIANHLGMTIETVCRTFGRMRTASLLTVKGRNLQIRNLEALKKVGSV
ncbi:helix-turn-helix domain-containing protein [Achromobacter spanius]|jgi:CRP/FNR family transcriptional regulator|uniref:helix-turn-helix domain-containing protein n=1 Tax=Achromobacter spanius TaxID=217203 RepID=UPI000A6574D5|nr:helix-turn-helix domain-containing protein [Achromobacter spanius]